MTFALLSIRCISEAEHLAALLTDAYPMLAADADKEVHSEYASIEMKAGFKASYPMFKA